MEQSHSGSSSKNSGSLEGPERFFDFKKELNIEGEKYQLGCMVLYDGYEDHFTSMHRVNGEWVYYDGAIKGKGARHRIPTKGDYIRTHIVVDHLMYVRCIEGEEV